jgi:hypothetical protein
LFWLSKIVQATEHNFTQKEFEAGTAKILTSETFDSELTGVLLTSPLANRSK